MTRNEIILHLKLASKNDGITSLSRKTKIDRATLYRTLSVEENYNASFNNILSIANALGFTIRMQKNDPRK